MSKWGSHTGLTRGGIRIPTEDDPSSRGVRHRLTIDCFVSFLIGWIVGRGYLGEFLESLGQAGL